MLLFLTYNAFAVAPPHALADPIASPASAAAVESTDGAIWVSEGGFVQRLDPSTGAWRSFGKLAQEVGEPALLPLADGAVRLVENNRADTIVAPDGRTTPAKGDLDVLALLQLFDAAPGKLWSVGATGVSLYDVDTAERTPIAEGAPMQTPSHAAANGRGRVLWWRPEETRRWSPDGTSESVRPPPLDHPTAAAGAGDWAWMIGAQRGRVLLTGLGPDTDAWTTPIELPAKTGGFQLWGLSDGRLVVGGADEPKLVIVDPRVSPPNIREVAAPWTSLHAKIVPTSHGLLLLDGGKQNAWLDNERGEFVRASPQVIPTAVLWSDRPLASNCPAGDRLFLEDSPGVWVDVAATPMHRTTGVGPSPICPVESTSSQWVAMAPALPIAWVFDAPSLAWTSLALAAPAERAIAGTSASWLIPAGEGAVLGVVGGQLAPTTLTAGDVLVASGAAAWSVTRDAIAGSSGQTGPGPGFTPMFGASPSERVVIAADLERAAVYDPKKSRWTPIEGTFHADTMRVFDGAVYAIGDAHGAVRYDPKHRTWKPDPEVPPEVSRDGAWLPAFHDDAGWRWIDADGLHRPDGHG